MERIREAMRMKNFEILKKDGDELVFQFDDPLSIGKRDIHDKGFWLINGKKYRVRWMDRTQQEGKKRYCIVRLIPKIIKVDFFAHRIELVKIGKKDN